MKAMVFCVMEKRKGADMQTAYIDIHCHILPQVDDGADSPETSLKMLELSEQQGAEAVILTPHYYHGRNRYQKGELAKRAAKLSEAAEKAGRKLRLCLGNEILWFDDAVEAVKSGDALSLAGSRYMLIEFYPQSSAQEIERAVRKVVLGGYFPVIAHYERYQAFRGEEGARRVENIIEQGALLQMNYSSLAGKGALAAILPDSNTVWCREEVRKGHVSFFGTDAHNLSSRTPLQPKAMSWLTKHLDEEMISELLYSNPEAVLADEEL